MVDSKVHLVKTAADVAPALLEHAGIAAYERDPLAQSFLLWLTKSEKFGGGELPSATDARLSYRSHIHEADAETFAAELVRALAASGSYQMEYRLRLADNRYVWVRDAGRIETAVSGIPLRARGILTFIEPYVMRAEVAEFAARFDAQTGRPNRQSLEETLTHVIRDRISGSMMIVSVDNMTFLNEALGPNAVNDLLRAAVQRLEKQLPEGTLIARTGGDGFGIWLPDHDQTAAEAVTQKILQAFRDEHFVTQECAVNVSVSAGGIALPLLATDGIEALTRAEQALKTARAGGRGSYRFYEPSEDRRTHNLASLGDIERFRQAMAAQDLVLAYQPIVSAFDGRIAFHEALLRLRQPDGTYISAWKLIQAFEQNGLAQELDRYVVGLAMAALRGEPALKLSVNLSAATVSSTTFQDYLHALLKDERTIAERIIWEITETAAVNDLTDTRRFVALMHEIGSKVALDDYGAGYTSLQHLQQLAVDKVKIDGSLIKGIVDSAQNQVMVKSILAMAQNMNLETVAEFVETEKEAAWLQRHGVTQMQGYFFGQAQIEMPTKKTEDEKAAAFLQSTGMLTLAV
ncbi:MAG: putative bifunctional diguanylate cyclase/phosphodiesterase [Bdellovibrionales bacterium]